ncbi:hypothetical protein [Pseudarthrobacter sp. N5]|uniref:hypothetical protein n=1 Tax=Pseudarthrobacter sp. N5 TaxID=3418416 RepID=UPI003CEE160E
MLFGVDGDLGDADEHVGLHGVGLERLVQQAGGGVGDQYAGAFQDRGVAGLREGLEGGAVEVEDVGLLRGDGAVDGDVTVELGGARVDGEVGEVDLGVPGGQGEAGAGVADQALDVGAVVLGRVVVVDLAAGDREDEGAVGECGGADDARGELEGLQGLGEGCVELDRGGGPGQGRDGGQQRLAVSADAEDDEEVGAAEVLLAGLQAARENMREPAAAIPAKVLMEVLMGVLLEVIWVVLPRCGGRGAGR